jgi:DNA-binding transcriptional ArsR family regulator
MWGLLFYVAYIGEVMNIRIQLNDPGPAMWFLGDDPKNLKVQLTFARPGPVELDFENLSEKEKENLLIGVRDGKLCSSVAFQDLYELFRQSQADSVPEPSPEVKKYLAEKERQVVAQKQFEKAARKDKRHQKVEDRANYLIKKSYRAIRAALTKEKDNGLVTRLYAMEKEGKNRTSVIKYLEERIRKYHQEISKAAEQQQKRVPSRTETIGPEVIESEEEIVVFPPGMNWTEEAK